MTLGRGGFFFDAHGPIIVDPNEPVPGGGSGPVEGDDEEQTRSWASQERERFRELRDAVQDILFDQYGIQIGTTPLGDVLNLWGTAFMNRNDGAFPDFDDILGSEGFWVQAQRRALNTSALPDWFWVDGPDGRVLHNNTGPFPATATIDDWLARPDALKPLGSRYGQPPNRESAYRLPVYSQEIFGSVLNLDALGIRRGGSGRRAPVWDKAALEEGIQSMWRPLMLEEAPTGLVDQFVAEHASFLRQGGNLDLESWVLGKMRETGKYQTIYSRKPAEVSEVEWIGQYRQLAAQTGLSAGQVSRETLRGASTGAAPAGFAQSLQESADVQAIGTGAMSRRFAQTLAKIPS